MNILVCGGAGFIGSNFIHYIHNRSSNDTIICLDKLTYSGNRVNLEALQASPRFRFVKGDIANRDLVIHLVEHFSIEAIVNFAAETHVDRSIFDPSDFIGTNVVGTFNLLEVVRALFKDDPTKRYLQISTDEVYGSIPFPGRFVEDSPIRPNSTYSASKASADHLVRAYHHTYGINALVTHCTNNYGPYQFPEKLIPFMIISALEGKPLPVYGDGHNVRDWIHVFDHCAAIDLVLRRGRSGENYNIGVSNELTNIELVRQLCTLIDKALKRKNDQRSERLITYIVDRPGHDRRYAIDPGKLSKELGFQTSIPFEDGLKSTVDWYISNEAWWRAILDRKTQLHFYGF